MALPIPTGHRDSDQDLYRDHKYFWKLLQQCPENSQSEEQEANGYRYKMADLEREMRSRGLEVPIWHQDQLLED